MREEFCFYREGNVGLWTQCLDFQPCVCVCVCVCVWNGGYPGGPGPSYSKHAPRSGHISITCELVRDVNCGLNPRPTESEAPGAQ